MTSEGLPNADSWKDGVVDWQKPISCHLYPIRITEGDGYEMVNYEPRRQLCRPACERGNKLKVPVSTFPKRPLKRKSRDDFYETLEAVANKMDAERR